MNKEIIEKVLKERYGTSNYSPKEYFIKSKKDGVTYVCKVIEEDIKKALSLKEEEIKKKIDEFFKVKRKELNKKDTILPKRMVKYTDGILNRLKAELKNSIFGEENRK